MRLGSESHEEVDRTHPSLPARASGDRRPTPAHPEAVTTDSNAIDHLLESPSATFGANAVHASTSDAAAAAAGDGSRTVIRGSLALFSTQPITWMMSAMTVAFVPRYLSARELGFFSVASSIAVLAGIFAALGVSNLVVRELGSGAADDSFAGSAFVLLVVSSVVVAGIVEAGLLLAGVRGVQLLVCEIAIAGMVVTIPTTMIGCKLVAERRFVIYAWLMVLTSLPMLSFLIALVLGGGLVTASCAGAASTVIPLVVGWRVVRWHVERAWVDREVWRRLLRGGIPFVALSVVMWVHGDGAKLMLNIMAGPEPIGWHAAAMRIPAVMVFIPTLLATPLLPTLNRQRDDRAAFNHTLTTTLLTAVLLTVPISAGVFGLAGRIPDVLGWSETYSHSIPLIRILVFEQPIVAVDVLLGTAAIALGSERRLLLNSTIAALASILLNVLLIPIFERRGNAAIGSDIAQLATEALLLILIVRALPRGTFGRSFVSRVARVAAAGVAMGSIISVLAARQFVLAGVAGLVVYGASLLVLRVFKVSEAVPALAQLIAGAHQRARRRTP